MTSSPLPARVVIALLTTVVSSAAADLRAVAPAWMAEVVPDARLNRVEEAQLMLRTKQDLFAGLSASGEAGFSTGLERVSATVRLRRGFAWTAGTTFVELDAHRGGGSHYGSEVWPQIVNSAQALLGLDDYFDYYWNQGTALSLGHELPGWPARLRLSLHDEDHESLGKTTDLDLLGRDETLRPNPAVDEGHMRRLGATLTIGGDYQPFDRGVNRRVEFNVEHSADWLGGDFDFTLLHAEADWSQSTWPTADGQSGSLDMRVTAGTHRGRLPVQRFGAIDVAVGPLSPYGTLRAASGHPFLGERYLALMAEHDFAGLLFEKVGLRVLSENGFALGAHAAYGETWIDAERRAELPMIPRWTKEPHREVGGSLTLFGTVRIDVTRRLEPGAWAAGINLTNYDWLW